MKKSLIIIAMLGILAAMTSCGNDTATSTSASPTGTGSKTASTSTTQNGTAAASAESIKEPENGIQLTDIYAGQSGTPHYTRPLEPDLSQTAEGVEAADYLGSWGCDRCVITISPNGSDYVANIEWKTGGGETLTHTKWTYDLTYDNSIAAMVCNSGGTCEGRVDMSDGTYTEKTRYTDGTAMFVMREGMLRWSDNKEDIANGMCFYN